MGRLFWVGTKVANENVTPRRDLIANDLIALAPCGFGNCAAWAQVGVAGTALGGLAATEGLRPGVYAAVSRSSARSNPPHMRARGKKCRAWSTTRSKYGRSGLLVGVCAVAVLALVVVLAGICPVAFVCLCTTGGHRSRLCKGVYQ